MWQPYDWQISWTVALNKRHLLTNILFIDAMTPNPAAKTSASSDSDSDLNLALEQSLSKSMLAPHNCVLLRFVDRYARKHNGAGTPWSVLFDEFANHNLARDGAPALHARLRSLVDPGHLRASQLRGENSNTYYLGTRHGGPRPQVAPAQPVTPPPSRPATPLPAHDPSVRLPQAARLGADDNLRVPSLRNGQRVPYRVGYLTALGSKLTGGGV